MNPQMLFGVLAISILAASSTAAIAADTGELGKKQYESNCILCHGKDLRGGAYVDVLRLTPPDLTQLSKKNGGVFPFERVYAVIDGRQAVKGHGTREMPIWGKEYQIKAAEYYGDIDYDPEPFVRGRILSLIDYLNRMQSK